MKVAPSNIFALCLKAFLTLPHTFFLFLCSSIDKPGCWMVLVRSMMVSWSECHQPHVCFLITRDLYKRRKIGSEIRFINPQNPGVQFLHISTGGHKSHAFYLVFAFVVRKRIRRSTNALRYIKNHTVNVYTVRYYTTA